MLLMNDEHKATEDLYRLHVTKDTEYLTNVARQLELMRLSYHQGKINQHDKDQADRKREREAIVALLDNFMAEEQCDENCELSATCEVNAPLIPHECIAYESLKQKILKGELCNK